MDAPEKVYAAVKEWQAARKSACAEEPTPYRERLERLAKAEGVLAKMDVGK